MLNRPLRIAMFVLVFCATSIVGGVVLAQDAVPALPIGEDELQKLVIALYAVGLPFVTTRIRALKPTMPRMLVWSIPPMLGLLSGWIVNYFAASGPVNGWRGVAGGLIAISLWELKTTFKDHGVNG